MSNYSPDEWEWYKALRDRMSTPEEYQQAILIEALGRKLPAGRPQDEALAFLDRVVLYLTGQTLDPQDLEDWTALHWAIQIVRNARSQVAGGAL